MMWGVPPMSAEMLDYFQAARIRNDEAIVAYLTHIGLTDIAFVAQTPTPSCDKFQNVVKFGLPFLVSPLRSQAFPRLEI